LAPIGPSITTGWGAGSLLNPNGITTPGTIYLVQEQGRILSNNCPSCSGVSTLIPGQQTDWGSICIIGIRTTTSPAVGTPIGCYCSPGLSLPFEELDLTYDVDYATANKTAIATVHQTGDKMITIDLDASQTMGAGMIEMRNLAGQLILTRTVRVGEEQVEILFNELSNMETGIYVLTVKTDSGLFTEKLFIQF
jgi:hypothetical protein